MAKSIELLLTENVENLGIVGDVVKVRTGFARNFLLPRALATTPSDEMIKSLQAKRADAERMLAEQKQARAATVARMANFELTLERSCNEQGVLYASVTQQEVAAALMAAGFGVRPRDVRLSQAIKRLDTYDVLIKYDTDLECHIKLWIVPDKKMESDDGHPDMDFDNEGNLIQPGRGRKRDRGERGERDEKDKSEAGAAEGTSKPEGKERKGGKKAEAGDNGSTPHAAPAGAEDDGDKPKKAARKPRQDKK